MRIVFTPATVCRQRYGAVLDAVLEQVTSANPETGHTIAPIASERGGAEQVTAVGPLPGAQAGEFPRLRGRWTSHPRRLSLKTITTTQATLSPTPRTRNAWPSLFEAAGEHVEVLSPEAGKEGDGQENGGHIREPAAHDRQVLTCERGVQAQQGGTSLLDRGEVGHDLLQLVVDVFGVQLGFAGGDISDLVGHSSTSVTEMVYRHEIRPALTDNATAVNRTLKANATGLTCPCSGKAIGSPIGFRKLNPKTCLTSRDGGI